MPYRFQCTKCFVGSEKPFLVLGNTISKQLFDVRFIKTTKSTVLIIEFGDSIFYITKEMLEIYNQSVFFMCMTEYIAFFVLHVTAKTVDTTDGLKECMVTHILIYI